MILEIEQDGCKRVTSLAFPRRQPRVTFFEHLAQMGRAFLVRMRSSV